MPLYTYECDVCKLEFDEFKSYKDRHSVYHCGKKAHKLITQCFTNPDLSYQFVTNIFDEPVQVRSKTHYRELLKKNNMPDCSPLESIKEAKLKSKGRLESDRARIKATSDRLMRKMQKDGVAHKAKEAIGKLVKGGINHAKRQSHAPA